MGSALNYKIFSIVIARHGFKVQKQPGIYMIFFRFLKFIYNLTNLAPT